jgi:uncharacterized membrane protein YeaQ/YmgE (transglycosylase-associated protein family)
LIGAVAGWLAGQLVKGRGFGLLGNMVVGVVGAFVGGFLAKQLGIGTEGDVVGVLLTSLGGAIVLLLLISVFKKA